MNLHSKLANQIINITEDEVFEEIGDEPAPAYPTCPRCGGSRFNQYYWGSFSNTRSIVYTPDRRPLTDYGSEENDETGSEQWECDNGHLLPEPLHAEIDQDFMDN
jgi:hypothetical protein